MFQLSSDEVHVWIVSLDASSEAVARLYASLSADERERSARFRFPRDRQRFVVAHGVLRDLLGRYLQTRAERIAFVCKAFGKPELAPEFGGRLKFNLSHATGLALVAVAGTDVGVDVERIRAEPDYAEVACSFFSAAEVERLHRLPNGKYAEAFIGCWTKKEAYLKARGEGLSVALDSFSVPLTVDAAYRPAEVRMAAMRWSFYTLQPAPGYIGALAIEGHGWRLLQRVWTMCPAAMAA